MKKLVLAALTIASTISVNAQTADTTASSDWKLKAIYGANGTQSTFVNWNAGGRNNISALAYIVASAKYQKDKIKWDNDLGLALGGLQYVGKGNEGESLQKTDDRIELASNFGYKISDKWFASFNGGFRTQFLDGFNFPNDSVRVSKFMAPGYLNLALGFDYTPNDKFSAFISPVASKMTFVQDETLANAGAFGVRAATYDNMGALLEAGEQFRFELGAYVRVKYEKEILKNINMKSKLELFSNYRENPGNIDVNAEVLFNFKVNDWFSASLNLNVLYDDDIRIEYESGKFGPRTQFKSVLGLGISYTMRNYKE